MKSALLKISGCITLIILMDTASAIDSIPSESGFSGYINLGGASIKAESNMIAGNSLGDLSKKTITSLTDSPDSETESLPMANFEVAYTFSDSQTQVYLGNQLEDFIEFDLSMLLGVRHALSDGSLIAASYVFSSIPTEVWKDPYLTNQPRSRTDRDSKGIRLEWDKIAGSGFAVQYTYRDIKLDDEYSGQALGLTIPEQDLLDREGNTQNLELSYQFNFQNGHRLKPKITYQDEDLDGGAMSSERWGVGLTHIYNNQQYSFITNLDWAYSDYDKQNPIYNKTRNNDRLGASFTAVYKNPFGYKDWNILGTIAYYDSDSNIDFYDTNIKLFGISALYRF